MTTNEPASDPTGEIETGNFSGDDGRDGDTSPQTHGGLEGHVADLITPTIEALGFEVVRVQLSGTKHCRLQVMAEPKAGGTMTVDDCAEISRAISAQLDVEDPISEAYALEVSSPGLDRPLTRAKDFVRFAGHEAKVEVATPLDGQKRFLGTLIGLEGEMVRLRSGDDLLDLPLVDIKKAKLIMTDKLLAEAENMQ